MWLGGWRGRCRGGLTVGYDTHHPRAQSWRLGITDDASMLPDALLAHVRTYARCMGRMGV